MLVWGHNRQVPCITWLVYGEVGRAVVDLHRAAQATSPHPAFLARSVPLVSSGSVCSGPATLPAFLPGRSWGLNQLTSNISFDSNSLRFYRIFRSQGGSPSAAQWLGHSTSLLRVSVQSLVGEVRFCKSGDTTKNLKIKNKNLNKKGQGTCRIWTVWMGFCTPPLIWGGWCPARHVEREATVA